MRGSCSTLFVNLKQFQSLLQQQRNDLERQWPRRRTVVYGRSNQADFYGIAFRSCEPSLCGGSSPARRKGSLAATEGGRRNHLPSSFYNYSTKLLFDAYIYAGENPSAFRLRFVCCRAKAEIRQPTRRPLRSVSRCRRTPTCRHRCRRLIHRSRLRPPSAAPPTR